jgi:hypothetical protein
MLNWAFRSKFREELKVKKDNLIGLSWHNLTLTVQVPAKGARKFPPWKRTTVGKALLDNVSGEVRPGDFLAILVGVRLQRV